MPTLRQEAVNAYLRYWIKLNAFPAWAVNEYPTYWQIYTDPPLDQGYYLPKADSSGLGGRVSFFYGDSNPTGTISVQWSDVDQSAACQSINDSITATLQNHTGSAYWLDLPLPAGFDEYIQYVASTVECFAGDDGSSEMISIATKIMSIIHGKDDPIVSSVPMSGVACDLLDFVVGKIPIYCQAMHDLLVVLQARLICEKNIWDSARQDRDKIINSAIEAFQTWDPSWKQEIHIDLNLMIGLFALASVFTTPLPALSMTFGVIAAGLALIPSDNKDLPSQKNPVTSFNDLLVAFDKAFNGVDNYEGSLYGAVNQRETELLSDLATLCNHAQNHDATYQGSTVDFAVQLPTWMSDLQREDSSSQTTYDKQKMDGFYVDPNKMHTITSQYLPDIMQQLVSARKDLDQAMEDYAWRRPCGLGKTDGMSETTGAYGQWSSFASAIKGLIDPDCGASPVSAFYTLDQVTSFIKKYMGEREDFDTNVAFQINDKCRPPSTHR